MWKVALVGLVVAWGGGSDDAEPAGKPIKARALKVSERPFELGGKDKLTAFKTEAELEKAVGKKLAAELARQVKFADEQVVVVSYFTSGPPFGELKHEVKGKGKKAAVEFYCKEPAVAQRGEAAKIGLDFFAVPKGVAVKYLGKK